ncbi:MAG: DUF1330 domain-containing protein [Pseudomonadota bacterium]
MSRPLQIVVLLKIREPGAFHEFETHANQIMARHSGRIVSAFKPENELSSDSDVHEVHILEFQSREDFLSYRSDPELFALAELRERAISATHLFTAGEYVSYEL